MTTRLLRRSFTTITKFENLSIHDMAFLQSRGDARQEFYKQNSKEESFSFNDWKFVPCDSDAWDEDAELAWRHATYNPPKSREMIQ